MELTLLWIIQLAPLTAFILILLAPAALRRFAPLAGMAAMLTASLASLKLLVSHLHSAVLPLQFTHRWLEVANFTLWPGAKAVNYELFVGFLIDPLNLLMITLVTTISFFVQVFSYYYMAEDPSRPRYFAFLSFFSFTMTGLVLSNNLLQTFLFWELVGLASYLLIGFWIEKPSAATAARKAFVINRLADLGFYLGILLMFMMIGSVNFVDLNSETLKELLAPPVATILGLLILTGVMGKSAQFPFHNWLPDAMEGPTPVSALIHSATMVAAGVFLLCRAFPIFAVSETVLIAVLVIGTLTALSGALLATIQKDIKKILAYSTISQLGFMVMAIGAGSTIAGMFHLSTHAFFKSLLFLTAGAFIHRFHSNDIWEIARSGGKTDRLAMGALAVGLLSLVGFPGFSGFFSKDLILETLKLHHPVFFGFAVLVSVLTAYYSFRLIFVLWFTKPHQKHGAHDHAHAAHSANTALLSVCRALPLVTLALISLWVGYLGSPLGHYALLEWLGAHHLHFDVTLLVWTVGILAAGAIPAYWVFRDPEAALTRYEKNSGWFKNLLENKLYVDAAYEIVTKQVALRFAGFLNWFDKTITNRWMVDWTSYRILDMGKVASKLQNGQLQTYLAVIAITIWAVIQILTKG